jgi:hypothetical protein
MIRVVRPRRLRHPRKPSMAVRLRRLGRQLVNTEMRIRSLASRNPLLGVGVLHARLSSGGLPSIHRLTPKFASCTVLASRSGRSSDADFATCVSLNPNPCFESPEGSPHRSLSTEEIIDRRLSEGPVLNRRVALRSSDESLYSESQAARGRSVRWKSITTETNHERMLQPCVGPANLAVLTNTFRNQTLDDGLLVVGSRRRAYWITVTGTSKVVPSRLGTRRPRSYRRKNLMEDQQNNGRTRPYAPILLVGFSPCGRRSSVCRQRNQGEVAVLPDVVCDDE